MTQQYQPSEVLVSVREPYNKNTLWIHPYKDRIEVKVYNTNKWEILSTTKDLGLSSLALLQVLQEDENLKLLLIELIKKLLGKFSNNTILLANKDKELEEKISNLEKRIDKLEKRIKKLISDGRV